MQKTADSPKRIVIIRNAYAYDFGGGERMPVELAVELAKHNYAPTIVSRSPKLLSLASERGIKTVRGWWWSKQNWSGWQILISPIYFGWQILLFFWYISLFLKIRPRIVHAQSKDDFISASLAARLVGARIIWSDHADLKYIYLNIKTWYKNPIGKAVKLCSRFASTIILTSQSDKRLVEEALGSKLKDKYKIIYNGIPDRSELLDKKSSKKIIFVATSRLVTAKGIGELIEAFRALKANYPTSELWLFGEGPEHDTFKRQARDQKSILFKGFPDDVLNHVALADVFVHPSYLEGFSISIIEAAMLGKPIIACAVGGNTEIINDKNGILIPPKDSQALAEAMSRLAKDPGLRKKLGDNARRKFEQNYVFKKIVKQEYLPIYEK